MNIFNFLVVRMVVNASRFLEACKREAFSFQIQRGQICLIMDSKELFTVPIVSPEKFLCGVNQLHNPYLFVQFYRTFVLKNWKLLAPRIVTHTFGLGFSVILIISNKNTLKLISFQAKHICQEYHDVLQDWLIKLVSAVSFIITHTRL